MEKEAPEKRLRPTIPGAREGGDMFNFIKWGLAIIYVVGYWFYVIAAGVYAWQTEMSFLEWIRYMVWQCTICGLLWPFFIW